MQKFYEFRIDRRNFGVVSVSPFERTPSCQNVSLNTSLVCPDVSHFNKVFLLSLPHVLRKHV